MGVVVSASAGLTVDADTRPGGTVPVPYGENSTFDRGFSQNGTLAGSDAVWTGRVVMPPLGGVKVSPSANTYSVVSGTDVYGPLAYTKDLEERAMNHYCWAMQWYNATSGAAGNSAYSLLWGTYTGAAGEWSGSTALGRIYRGDGVLQTGYGIEGTHWILYNGDATETQEVEISMVGKYNG